MPTPEAKEWDAMALRGIADRATTLLDSLDTASRSAWDCPAADGFEAELRYEMARLAAIGNMLEEISRRLVVRAAAQREAEAAEVAIAASGGGLPPPAPQRRRGLDAIPGRRMPFGWR